VDESRVFLDALKLASAADRAVHLDAACAGNPRLRAGVEALLLAHAADPSFLEHPEPSTADLPPGGTAESPPGPADRTDAGLVLAGRYGLLEEIGEGGMGTVWLARQTEPVTRTVAVKLIKAGMDSAQVIARFGAERQALALMDHPNIAKVLDAGATPDGRPYFVMELVKGVPITQYCDENRLTPRQRLELFSPVCQAIQHAHQKGIIHRDIKPSNVLVARYDDKPVPKVIDFGVAKAVGQPLTDRTLVTGVGAVVGTPEYMSPEQASFNPLDVDTRSDVYSLGVLLYELLAGSPPFSRKDLAKAGLLEILRVIREDEPPRPSTRLSTADGLPSLAANRGTEPRKLCGLVRGELDWIVMKALEKDRTRRYETAVGLAADLQHYLADEPVQACPPSAAYRIRKFVRRHRGPVLAAAVLLVALAATLAVALYSNTQVNWALNDRTAAFHQLEKEQENTAEALRRETALKDQQAGLTKRANDALDQSGQDLYSFRIALAYREWEAGRVARADSLLDECPATLRSWEWHYLKRLCHSDLYTLNGRSGYARALRFLDDDRLAAICHNMVHVWDGGDGRAMTSKVLAGEWTSSRAPGPCALSRTGLSAACLGDSVVIQNVHSGAELRGIPVPGVVRFWFSEDGTRLATCQERESDRVRVWDVGTGKELFQIRGDSERPAVCTFFGGSAEIVHAESDGSNVTVRDSTTGAVKVRWSRDIGRVEQMAVDSSGRRLATYGFPFKCIKFWDLHEGKLLWELPLGDSSTGGMLFHPRKPYLVFATGTAIKVWGIETREEWLTIRGHPGRITGLAFRPDGDRLASGSLDGTVKVWDTTALDWRTPANNLALGFGRPLWGGRPTTSLSLSRDGKYIATPDVTSRAAMIWDTGSRTRQLIPMKGQILRVEIAPVGNRFAAIHGDNTIRIFDPRTGEEVAVCRGLKGAFSDMSFSPDGGRLAGVGGGPIVLWDAATGQEGKSLPGLRGPLAFSPDSRQLVACDGSSGRAVCVDVASGAIVWKWAGVGSPSCAAFSGDGRRLAVGIQLDKTIRVVDARTGDEQLVLGDHDDTVVAVAFHPGEQRLAAVTGSGALVLWDLDIGREALTLPAAPRASGRIRIAFSPDGDRLYRPISGGVEILDATPLPATAPAGQFNLFRRFVERGELEKAAGEHNEFFRLRSADHATRLLCAEVYADAGRWAEAAADYDAAFALRPHDDPMHWFQHAFLYLKAGDAAGYSRHCEKMLAHFGKDITGMPLVYAAHACVIGPGALGNPARVVALAKQRLALQGQHPHDVLWARHVLALARYRAGEHDEAARELTALPANVGDSPQGTLNGFVLAMSYHKLGRGKQARDQYDAAAARVKRFAGTAAKASTRFAPPGWRWRDWLAIQLLQTEAAALLGVSP
jgi:WD40 repeat protein